MPSTTSARRRTLSAAPAVALALGLSLAGCAEGGDAEDSGAEVSVSEGSESVGVEDPDTAGDGDEPAETSELSTRVGQSVTFSARVTERIGDHALAVTAPEAGTDPVLVYGAVLTPAMVEGAGVEVTGTVEVFDRDEAAGELGEDAVGEGTERFDGTPAVRASTADALAP